LLFFYKTHKDKAITITLHEPEKMHQTTGLTNIITTASNTTTTTASKLSWSCAGLPCRLGQHLGTPSQLSLHNQPLCQKLFFLEF